MDKRSGLETFWKGKKVFITGHTGFKGSWLTEILLILGANIKGYSLPADEDMKLHNGLEHSSRMNSVYGDINDSIKIKNEIEKYQPEIIFHLAAQPLVKLSYADPFTTYTTNIIGTFNVIQSTLSLESVKSIIIVTSDKCYENKEWDYSYRENDPLGGYDPYSASKACAEIISHSMNQSFNTKNKGFSTVRAGNVIGGGDFSQDRLIPDIIKAIEKGEKLLIRNPNATRPWQHVVEPLFAYLELAEKQYKAPKKYSGKWNVGPYSQNSKNVEYILNYINKTNPDKLNWIKDESDQPHEAQLLELNSSKLIKHTSWEPKWNIEETLDLTLNWYIHFLKGENIKTLCRRDIENYLS